MWGNSCGRARYLRKDGVGLGVGKETDELGGVRVAYGLFVDVWAHGAGYGEAQTLLHHRPPPLGGRTQNHRQPQWGGHDCVLAGQ